MGEQRCMAGPRTVAALLIGVLAVGSAAGQQQLSVDDLVIEEGADGGYHIWVRSGARIGSVLLTESSADPARRLHSYALRAPQPSAVQAGERRLLDGRELPATLNSIVDSSTEQHPQLGAAFHLFVPYVVRYGYRWSRSGELEVRDGTFLNIRTFSEQYADYRGAYADNPFVLRVVQAPAPAATPGGFNAGAVESFAALAADAGGIAVTSTGREDVPLQLDRLLATTRGESLDLVLALDTTKSMEDDLPHLQANLVEIVTAHADRFAAIRVGVLLYRDYAEEYLVRPLPFMALDELQPLLDTITVAGGRDIPEAVHEALDASVREYVWQAEARTVVLIGDAPPHPRPRGTVTEQMVLAAARERGVRIHTVILESAP